MKDRIDLQVGKMEEDTLISKYKDKKPAANDIDLHDSTICRAHIEDQTIANGKKRLRFKVNK